MRLRTSLLARLLPAVALHVLAGAAIAAPALRLVAADERGVTVRLDVPAYELTAPDAEGRVAVRARGMGSAGVPGRPELPVAATLIALPPGARAVARVIEEGPAETHDVRLRPIPEPTFEPHERLGLVPTARAVPMIADGVWPRAAFELDEPYTLRFQRVVNLRVQPGRYDETAGRLTLQRSMTVRVDFVGAGGAALDPAGAERPAFVDDDRGWEPVLRNVTINYEQGRRFRVAPPGGRRAPSGGARIGPAGALGAPAFDEQNPEVRIRVDSSGVYAIPFEDLAVHAFPAGIPVGEVSVHRHEFLENTAPPDPPYTTIELPCEVIEAEPADGVFGDGDRIDVYVQNWAERSGATLRQRTWGDAEVIYVTRAGSGSGRRVTTRPGWLGLSGLTPLASYPTTTHYERNGGLYINFPADTSLDQFVWSDLAFYYTRADTFPVVVNHLDTTRRIVTAVTWRGNASTAHYNFARLRKGGTGELTTIVDSTMAGAVWSGRGQTTVRDTVFGSALAEGAGNRLGVWGRTNNPPSGTPAELTNTPLNWYEITYWRRWRALRGYFEAGSGDAVGPFQVLANGFAVSDVRVWDITDPANAVQLAIDPGRITPTGLGDFQLEFQDDATAGPRRYVLYDVNSPKLLPPESYSRVTRAGLWNAPAADYVLITPGFLTEEFQPLASLRQAQGLATLVAPLEALNDEFNGGRKSAYAIKRFMRHAFNHWGTRFALLGGEGSEDPQDLRRAARLDLVPVWKVASPVPITQGLESVTSDFWYVWALNNPDPQLAPRIPDLFLGRVPVETEAEASAVVAKLVAYEQVDSTQIWRREVLLHSDDMYSDASIGISGGASYCWRQWEDKFQALNEVSKEVILTDAGLRRMLVEHFDMAYLLRDEPVVVGGPGDTCRPDLQATRNRTRATISDQLFARLSAGRSWWNFHGHANEFVLTHEDLYVNPRGAGADDKDRIDNPGKLSFFSAFSCHPNAFARYNERAAGTQTLGEELVEQPGRGAVASWASTGFEVIPSRYFDHLSVDLTRALYENPPRDPYLGDGGARVLLGEAIAQALIANNGKAFGSERDVAVTYTLLGDPATRFSIGPPQITVTANGQPVEDGEPVRLTSGGDTLTLEADIVSNVELRSIQLFATDGAGTREIPAGEYRITPAFPDSGAASHGGRWYHVVFDTTLTRGGAFRYTFRTVDRWNTTARFDVVFQFETALFADDVPIRSGDVVARGAALALVVRSPNPLVPQDDLTLTLDGASLAFVPTPALGDTSGRNWRLTWDGAPYAAGTHTLVLLLDGQPMATWLFRVEGGLRLENAMVFPNPFEDDLGARFTFTLLSDQAADVGIRVYTASGRLVYQTERTAQPGYNDVAWDARDAEGDKLANGTYFYRLVAKSPAGSAVHEGRMVKLRKPRRVEEEPASVK